MNVSPMKPAIVGLVIFLLLAACSPRVEPDASQQSVVLDKSHIDLADSAPIFDPGSTIPTTNWVCTLLGKTSADRDKLMGLQGKPVEIKDGPALLGRGKIVGTTVSARDNKAGLRIAAESREVADSLYKRLGIWPKDAAGPAGSPPR